MHLSFIHFLCRLQCIATYSNAFVINLSKFYYQLPYQNIRYLVHICRKLAPKLAASLRHIVAASLLQTRFSYANFFSGTLVLAHNVRRKYAAHSCRTLFWHTMYAASMQRTVVAHYSGDTMCAASLQRTGCGTLFLCATMFAAHSCRALSCSAPSTPPPPHPWFISHPPPHHHHHIGFSSLPPKGV